MPKMKPRSRVAVLEKPVVAQAKVEPDALWSIAMLRIAMELKRPDAPALEAIIDGVVARMGIPKAQFKKYLAEEIGELQEVGRALAR